LEFFDIVTMTKVNQVKIGKFFSLMLRVNPPDLSFMLNDKFIQETCIGYHAKSFTNSAIMCERTNESADIEMQEELKEEIRLQNVNITRLEQLMIKECENPVAKRRLTKKNINMSAYCQVETAPTEDSPSTNILYTTSPLEIGEIYRF